MATGSFYIGERSISSGGKVHRRYEPITPEKMKLDDKIFMQLVKNGRIKKGTPPKPEKKSPPDIAGVKEGEKGKEVEKPVLREDRILQGIRDLFNKDGKPKSKDDFTQDGLPRTDSLDVLVLLEGEDEVSAEERDAAWSKYQEEQKQKNN